MLILSMVLITTPLDLYIPLLTYSWYAYLDWIILVFLIVLWFRLRKSATIQKKDIWFGVFLFFFCLQLSFSFVFRWYHDIFSENPQTTGGFLEYITDRISQLYYAADIKVKFYGIVGILCGYSAVFASILASESVIANEVKRSSDNDFRRFLLTMISSVAMLTVIVGVASFLSKAEPATMKHICALSGFLIAVVSISVGAYTGGFNYRGMRFIGNYLFPFICGSLMGYISLFTIGWPFVVTLIYGIPVVVSLMGFHYVQEKRISKSFVILLVVLVIIPIALFFLSELYKNY